MNQVLKQARIKTNTVKRLKKEYLSYKNQCQQQKNKIDALPSGSQEADYKLKKQVNLANKKQFMEESVAVLNNVKQKLQQSYDSLVQFMQQKGQDEGLVQQDKGKALQQIQEVKQFLQNIHAEGAL